jgi:hypothetical protein
LPEWFLKSWNNFHICTNSGNKGRVVGSAEEVGSGGPFWDGWGIKWIQRLGWWQRVGVENNRQSGEQGQSSAQEKGNAAWLTIGVETRKAEKESTTGGSNTGLRSLDFAHE